MIAGLESVTSGEIYIGDRLVNSVAPKDRDIAMVFQSYALYPTMTVRENMAFGMESRGIPKDSRRKPSPASRRCCSSSSCSAASPASSRAASASASRWAVPWCAIRCCSCSTSRSRNLDAKLRVDMRTEIKKLHHRVGKTTVYVTHDQVEAMTLASRIAVMHQGEVQQFDEPDVVYNRPANMFVAGFMGSPSMNFMQRRADQ